MELEELMRNHDLLRQMSEFNASTPQRTPRVNHQIDKESTAEVTNERRPSVVLVPEGYGCKYSTKLKRVYSFTKVLLLILYIFGAPVVLYRIYTHLKLVQQRMDELTRLLDEDVESSKHLEQHKNNKKDEMYNSQKRMEEIRKHAAGFGETTAVKRNFDIMLRKIKDNLAKKEKRLDIIEAVGKWLKKNPEVLENKCECDDASQTEAITTPSPVDTEKKFKQKRRSVYIRWGKTSCPERENVTTLYQGYVGGTSNRKGSSGANYLCLRHENGNQNYSYVNTEEYTITDHTSYIYGALVDDAVTGFHQALCSVCETSSSAVIMIPGTTECPESWSREYNGFLMAQTRGRKRTSYICVDAYPDIKEKFNPSKMTYRVLTSLNFVRAGCNVLPCDKGGYDEDLAMTCIVCCK